MARSGPGLRLGQTATNAEVVLVLVLLTGRD